MRTLWLGFGNVGRELARLLSANPRLPGIRDLDVRVVGIVTGRHGSWADPTGLDLAAVLRDADAGRRGAAPLDALTAAERLDYDVLVEMTPLDVAGRGAAAIAHCRAAIARDRHVVSCNKGPVAWAFRELSEAARHRGVQFLFETAVMDGIPVFNLARHGLRGATVERIEGVLNSTTNLVLAEMEAGSDLPTAVRHAQSIGVAEADPALDLDGWDAAVKIAALANVLMGIGLAPEDVTRTSLRSVDPGTVSAALAAGRRCKLVASARREADTVRASVDLVEVDSSDVFSFVEGTGAAVRITCDIPGSMVVLEERPTLATTAYGVLSDLLTIRAGSSGRTSRAEIP